METQYRIVEGIGPYMNRRWELQEKYRYIAKIGDEDFTEGWALCCHGTREFCEEALQNRLVDDDGTPLKNKKRKEVSE